MTWRTLRSRRWRPPRSRSWIKPRRHCTIAELEEEIRTLRGLESEAAQARSAPVMTPNGRSFPRVSSKTRRCSTPISNRRKLVIFTEHRDTLNYLVPTNSATLAGQPKPCRYHSWPDAAGTAPPTSGSLHAMTRKCLILVATDAAGEGINLHRAPSHGELRLTVESQSHRATLRAHPSYRPARGLPSVESRRDGDARRPRFSSPPPETRKTARGSRGCRVRCSRQDFQGPVAS